MGKRRNKEKELGFEKEVNSLGSKLISVIVSLAVVLGLSLVPVAPAANIALAEGPVGMEYQPDTIAVGPGGTFHVNVTLINTVDQDIAFWTIYSEFNASMLTVNSITPCTMLPTGNPPDDIPGFPDWDNTPGSAQSGDPDAGWLNHQSGTRSGDPYVTTSFVMATVTFQANDTNLGTTEVNFRVIDPFHRASALDPDANNMLDWDQVVNLTVTISSGTKCCVDAINGNGGVTIDGNPKGVGECSDTGELLDHTFVLAATPDGGWVFTNWSANVNDPNSATTTIDVPGGGTDNVTVTFTQLANQTCTDTNLLNFGTLFVGGANPANRTFDVINCGGYTLNWTSSVNYVAWPSANVTLAYSPQTGGPLGNASSDTVDVAVDISNATSADGGTYTANITVADASDPNDNETVTVTFALSAQTIPCRNIILPHGTFVYPGETYDVNITWTITTNVVGVALWENTSVTNATGGPYLWDTVTQVAESHPCSKGVAGTGGTSVEYLWNANYAPGTAMWVHYTSVVPANAAPGLYNMTVCPANATVDGAPVEIEYYLDATTVVSSCIGCNFSILVATPAYLEGTVWEVVWNWFRAGYDGAAGNLTLSGVNVTAKDGILVWNITDAVGYYNISVVPGQNYTVTATHVAGDFAPKSQVVNIPALGGVVVCDFVGVNGLEPYAPFYNDPTRYRRALSYALKACNCWLIGQSYAAGDLTLTEVGNVTAMWLATP